MLRTLLLLLSFSFFVTGCSSGGGSGGGSSSQHSFDPGCVTVTSYPGGISLSGNAVYEYRTNGNQAVYGTPNPIRQAQVSVYSSGGSLIQCGTTDDSGIFSVTVPATSDTYTLRVSARIYNDATKAAVFNNPTDYTVHYISTTSAGTASASVGTLTASATGDLMGGAFNILDKIYSANAFLYTTTAGCSTAFSSCAPFTGASPVFIFWDKGVNPGNYFNAGALSFYLPGESELYILGGMDGDTDSSDCDHFDNSIILHEYGHFIEDLFAKTDSPGGSHNGNTILDARLAWGEGWANFFQAAVLNNPVYRDTSGNVDGTASVFFNEDLETPTNDIPTTLGQGNFREFSVTRMLWDAIDSVNEGSGVDQVTSPFSELWTVFTSSTDGIKNTDLVFRNVGLYHSLQQSLPGASDWSSIRTGENQRGDENDYARDVASSTCSAVAIQAANISPGSPENGQTSRSNQFASNDFYKIYHAGGTFLFQLNYTVADSNSPADLDVYIYNNAYRFTDTSATSIAASATTNISTPSSSGSETLSVSLAAGWYMINVRVDTSVRLGSSSSYTMTYNGAQLCPN